MTKWTVRVTRVTHNLDAYHIDVEADSAEAASAKVEAWCNGDDTLTPDEEQSERHVKDYGALSGESAQVDADYPPYENAP
jgi:hypothetical protein